MRPSSYVGISGLMSRGEVDTALAAYPDCGRQLMVGVLASEKTLAGQPNKWPRRYPKREDIAGIFIDDPRCLNLVHVAVDRADMKEPWLDRALFFGGARCHGVQLNAPAPSDRIEEHGQMRAIGSFLRIYPVARLVVQLRPVSGADAVARATMLHDAGATDVLIDASGGRGLNLNLASVALAVQQIRRACPNIGIGIAGGLCAETVPAVAHIIRDGVSCDAEGRLRDDADGGGDLDMEKTRAYLAAAGEAVAA